MCILGLVGFCCSEIWQVNRQKNGQKGEPSELGYYQGTLQSPRDVSMMLIKWMIWQYWSPSCSSQSLCDLRQEALFILPVSDTATDHPRHSLVLLAFSMGCTTCLLVSMTGEEVILSLPGSAFFPLGTRSCKAQGQRDSPVSGHLMAGGPGR